MARKNILGVTSLEFRYAADSAPTVMAEFVVGDNFVPYEFTHMEWDEIIPGKAIVKCGYCGQFAARKTACVHCGGAVE